MKYKQAHKESNKLLTDNTKKIFLEPIFLHHTLLLYYRKSM